MPRWNCVARIVGQHHETTAATRFPWSWAVVRLEDLPSVAAEVGEEVLRIRMGKHAGGGSMVRDNEDVDGNENHSMEGDMIEDDTHRAASGEVHADEDGGELRDGVRGGHCSTDRIPNSNVEAGEHCLAHKEYKGKGTGVGEDEVALDNNILAAVDLGEADWASHRQFAQQVPMVVVLEELEVAAAAHTRR